MVKKIPIGPFHPILEEPEFFELHVDGERVVGIDMTIGWSHRGIELLSEHTTRTRCLSSSSASAASARVPTRTPT